MMRRCALSLIMGSITSPAVFGGSLYKELEAEAYRERHTEEGPGSLDPT